MANFLQKKWNQRRIFKFSGKRGGPLSLFGRINEYRNRGGYDHEGVEPTVSAEFEEDDDQIDFGDEVEKQVTISGDGGLHLSTSEKKK